MYVFDLSWLCFTQLLISRMRITYLKQASLAISAYFLLLLLPLVFCSSHEGHEINPSSSHKSIKDNFHKVPFFLCIIFFINFFFGCMLNFFLILVVGLFFILQLSPQMTFNVTVHGLLLWFSMGFLMPVGILIIRLSVREEQGTTRAKVLFYFHVIFQARFLQLI